LDFHYDKISEAVVRRLTDYLRCIRLANKMGKTMLTSQDISQTCGLKPSIIRKDLAQFGAYGVKGMGYNTCELINHLNKILGINHTKDVVLVGAGNLGTAIMRYPGFGTANFNFIAAFDNDPEKIGLQIGNTHIYDIKDMHEFIEKNNIEIVILAVPGEAASVIVEDLDPTLVKGILNFSSLVLPPQKNNMHVHNIDLAKELEVISFCMKNCLTKDCEN
jgi:redox-sensing transcriptional repressor